MKKALKWLDDNIEVFLCGILLGVITIVMFVQVICRYVLGHALPWPEEFCRYCYIWITFLSIGLTIRTGSYFRVTALIDLLPKKGRRAMEILVQLVNVAFFGACAYVSIDIFDTVLNSTQTSAAMRLPMYIVYIALPLGMFLSAIRSIQMLFLNIRSLITGKELAADQTEAETILESLEAEENKQEVTES